MNNSCQQILFPDIGQEIEKNMETYDDKYVDIQKYWINLNESNERNIQVKIENILLFLKEELKITIDRETLNSKEN